jgi:hypothetical protein
MSLLDAQPFDEKRQTRRRIIYSVIILAVLALAFIAWELRFLPEERVANKFFARLQAQDFEGAYGAWQADPAWKQHPEKYSAYPYQDFYNDWGPRGTWGTIQSHKLESRCNPPGGGSGVIEEFAINGRAEHQFLWVQKSNKSISFAPEDYRCPTSLW